MQIAILLFRGFTPLDAIGPYEVLHRLPSTQVRFVAADRGVVRSVDGAVAMVVEHTFKDLRTPDVIVVPGGPGIRQLLTDMPTLKWVRHGHGHSKYTASVGTGAMLLGAAGLLTGIKATTHWARLDRLPHAGAMPVEERVVFQDRIVTCAGVSAGLDMALALAEKLSDRTTARGVQLAIEYDPQPPYDAGALEKASPEEIAFAHASALRRRELLDRQDPDSEWSLSAPPPPRSSGARLTPAGASARLTPIGPRREGDG